VCRRKGPQSTFVRVRYNNGSPTTLPKAEGRSAYCCPAEPCRDGLLVEKRLERAFKQRINDEARLRLAQEIECHQR